MSRLPQQARCAVVGKAAAAVSEHILWCGVEDTRQHSNDDTMHVVQCLCVKEAAAVARYVMLGGGATHDRTATTTPSTSCSSG